jgi:hypothetical protein
MDDVLSFEFEAIKVENGILLCALELTDEGRKLSDICFEMSRDEARTLALKILATLEQE